MSIVRRWHEMTHGIGIASGFVWMLQISNLHRGRPMILSTSGIDKKQDF